MVLDVDEGPVDDEAGVTNPNWLPVTTVTSAPSVTSLGSYAIITDPVMEWATASAAASSVGSSEL